MYHTPPKKCHKCGAKVYENVHEQENWDKLATFIECVDEGGGTIGYNVICYNCNEGVCNAE